MCPGMVQPPTDDAKGVFCWFYGVFVGFMVFLLVLWCFCMFFVGSMVFLCVFCWFYGVFVCFLLNKQTKNLSQGEAPRTP